jgi:CubicO group peptidase (beta-lactamase class C family)
MAHFLSAHLGNGQFQGRTIIAPDAVRRMHQPYGEAGSGRAMGWVAGSWNELPVLHKEGATATSYAFMALLPEENIAFIFLTNVNAFNPIVNSVEGIPKGILNILTGQPAGEYFPFNLIVLLGFGVLLVLSVIDLVGKLIKWIRTGMPTRSGEARGAMLRLVFLKLVIPIGIAWAFLWYFDIPLNSLLAIQPDIGWTIVISIFTGFVGGFLEHFTKVKTKNV